MELHRPSGRRALGIGLASVTMLLWGVLPMALQITLRDLDAVTITWFRFLVSTVVLAAALAVTGRLPKLSRLPRSGWWLLGIATVFLAANYWGYLVGLDRTSAGNAQVLIQAAPLLLALGGIFVFGERFSRAQWVGFGVLVGGLGLFFASQLRELAGDVDRYLSGVGIIGLAALTWAVYGLAQKQLLRSLSSQQIMLCIYAGCALCFAFASSPAEIAALGEVELAALIFCALNTLVAYGAFAAALAHWEASRVSAVLALTPLATLAFTALGRSIAPQWVAEEHVAGASLFGAGAVVAGSLLVALGSGRSSRSE